MAIPIRPTGSTWAPRRRLCRAPATWSAGRLVSAALPGATGELLTLEGASVDPAAQVRGGTAVGAGARVGADAYVTGIVLFDAASVGAGARVSGSVIGRGTVVGEGVVLDGVVLGDEVHIAPGNELRSGLRVWPGQTLGLTCVPLLLRRVSPCPASRNSPVPAVAGDGEDGRPATASGERPPAGRGRR